MIYTPNTVDVDLELKFLSYLIFDDATNLFGIEEVDFSHNSNRIVFKELKDGAILNHQKLKELGLPERFIDYISDNQVNNSVEMERIAEQLKGMSDARRRLIQIEREKHEIAKKTPSQFKASVKTNSIKDHTYNQPKLKARLKGKAIPQQIDFFPKGINEVIPYFNTKWLCFISASTGVGKTSTAIQISRSIAENEGSSTLYVTLEMNAEQFTERAYSIMYYEHHPEADMSDWMKHKRTLKTYDQMDEATKPYEILIDMTGATIEEIRNQVIKIKQQVPDLKMVVIDHIYILHSSKASRSEFEEQKLLVESLQSLAEEADVRILALCQTRKGGDDGRYEEPILEDIRGSKSITEQSWWTLGLWRDKEDVSVLNWKVLKGRNGEPVGKKGKVKCRGTYLYDDISHFNNPNN